MLLFLLVHVPIENVNASHKHAIQVVLNQVYGASGLATFKELYEIVWYFEHIHITGDAFWPKVNANAYRNRYTSPRHMQ